MQPFADLSWPLTVMLVSLRLGAIMLLTPIFSLVRLPVRVRVMFVLALAAFLVDSADLKVDIAAFRSPASLGLAAFGELAMGMTLSFGLFAAFAAFQFAGRVLDVQLGFGVAGLIDPATKQSSPLLGTVLGMTAVLTFFLVDGHHLLLRGVAFSLEQVPPGAAMHLPPVERFVAQFGAMFTAGTVLALPVMIVVLMLDVAMAMVARTMPQMNVFIIGLPVKILVGLIALAIVFNFMGPVYSSVFEGLFSAWQALLS
jgi:flagellar biosynthesis protein FliR